MSSTLDRSNGSSSVTGAPKGKAERLGRGSSASNERLPKPNKVRRPVMAVASTVLIFASIAIFAGLYANAGHRFRLWPSYVRSTKARQSPVPISERRPLRSAAPYNQSRTPLSALSSESRQPSAWCRASSSPPGISQPPAQFRRTTRSAGIARSRDNCRQQVWSPVNRSWWVQTGQPGSPAPGLPNSGSSSTSSSGGASTSPASSAGSSSSSSQSGGEGVLVPRAQVYDVASPSAASGDAFADNRLGRARPATGARRLCGCSSWTGQHRRAPTGSVGPMSLFALASLKGAPVVSRHWPA